MAYEGFNAVAASAKASGASDPGAVAASIGRKKYGAKAFNKAAASGKSMRGQRTVSGETLMPKDMEGVMQEYKSGDLHSGASDGPKVTSRKQAIAIGLSEQRQMGKKVPAPKRSMSGRR